MAGFSDYNVFLNLRCEFGGLLLWPFQIPALKRLMVYIVFLWQTLWEPRLGSREEL